MKTAFQVFSLLVIFVMGACGSTLLPTTPEPAPAKTTVAVPGPESTPPANPTIALVPTPDGPVAVPADLRIVYLRGGNLWSWAEAEDKKQLTDSGDISTVRLSNDGRMLAFLRGREVWVTHMDGTNAQMLATLDVEGADFWFAPGGSLLAVSAADHIEVIDLGQAISTTVVNYPPIPSEYYPQIVWSPDGLGFKTVIPPQRETGQAEFLFVFTSGTVASLAKFMMVPLTESLPIISPDGGYVIYVAKMSAGKEALYLMDSSGATRPYGEVAEHVHTFGWLPDSKHFIYGVEPSPRAFLGEIGGSPMEIQFSFVTKVRWIDMEHMLTLENGDLRLGDFDGGSLLIDSYVQEFDFVP